MIGRSLLPASLSLAELSLGQSFSTVLTLEPDTQFPRWGHCGGQPDDHAARW